MFAGVALFFGIRFGVLEPVALKDATLQPSVPAGQRIWICKLPMCLESPPMGSLVLASTRAREPVLRWVLGTPGMVLQFGPLGRVQYHDQFWVWRREHTIIDEQTLRVPAQGDTLYLDSLGPMAFDMATRLYRKQWPEHNITIEVSLMNGQVPMPLSEVGRTTIANRPVSQTEIAGLPWQELRLLEMQLQHLEASEHPIRFHRRLLVDSLEIKQFPVLEDCWFLVCSRGAICVDSREEGFFTRSDLLGAPLPWKRLAPKSPFPPSTLPHP